MICSIQDEIFENYPELFSQVKYVNNKVKILNEFDLVIYKLIFNEIEQSEFEEWVYSEKKLVELLLPEDYLDLISLNYHTPSSLYDARKILMKYIKISECYEWHLKSILLKIIDRPIDVYKYIQQCYDLYCDGYYFLDDLGLGFGLPVIAFNEEIGIKYDNKMKITTQEELIDGFYPEIIAEVEKVICWLEKGKIKITGHSGEYQGIEYDDNRTTEEKKPTAYQSVNISKSWWKFW